MNRKTTLLIICISIFIYGCNKNEEYDFRQVEFATNSDTYYFGEEVKFKNFSIEIDSFLWNFGDSTYSHELSPTKTYEESGSYKVELIGITEDKLYKKIKNITIEESEFKSYIIGKWEVEKLIYQERKNNIIILSDTTYYNGLSVLNFYNNNNYVWTENNVIIEQGDYESNEYGNITMRYGPAYGQVFNRNYWKRTYSSFQITYYVLNGYTDTYMESYYTLKRID